MKRLFSILSLLLLSCTMVFAEAERVKIADITNGSVDFVMNGQTVTLTVTPSDGYYLESIKAVKTLDASAASRSMVEIPVLGEYSLTKTSVSEDRSKTATYTLTLDEEFGAYVTAFFAARTTIIADQVSLSASEFEFNSSDQKPTVTVAGLVEGTDYTVSYTETAWTNVGIYSVTVTGIDTQKGEITKTWSVTPAELSGITAEDYEDTYDGVAHTIKLTAPIGTTVKYGTVEGTYDKDVAPTITNVGSITVYYQVSQANYTTVTGSRKVIITKAPLTISVGNYTRKKGKENPEFVLSYEGFKNDETEEVLIKKPTVTTTATKTSPTGEYPIEVSGAEAQNYEITHVGGLLTVELLLGDANSDGELSEADRNYITRHIMGDTPDDFDNEAANLNGDDRIDVADIVLLNKLLQ